MIESTLAASAARTATGTGSPVSSLGGQERPKGPARIFVKITAISGAGATLTPILRGYVKGVLVTIATLTAMTAVGEQTLLVDACPDNLQLDYTIAGTTPSITFEAYSVRG